VTARLHELHKLLEYDLRAERRIDPGPERRRRWASSEKASIVEESLPPGAAERDALFNHRTSSTVSLHRHTNFRLGWLYEQGQGFITNTVGSISR